MDDAAWKPQVTHVRNAGRTTSQLLREEADSEFRSVVLLGSGTSTRRMSHCCTMRNLPPYRAKRLMSCGRWLQVLADRGWRRVVAECAARIARFSSCKDSRDPSMLFLRLGIDSLAAHVARSIGDMQRSLYGAERDSATFCHGTVWYTRHSAHIAELSRAASLMKAADETRFSAPRHNCRRRILARALATKRVRSRHSDGLLAVRTLQAGMLEGGKSGAKIVMLSHLTMAVHR